MTERWWRHAACVYAQDVRVPGAGELLVGRGNPRDRNTQGIALSSKFAGSKHRSVSAYVLHADADTIAYWRAVCPRGAGSVERIVMEDLSLDSCFALLLWGQIVDPGGVDSRPTYLEDWCRYVTRWEQGYTRHVKSWETSPAFLLTALGHSFLTWHDEGGPLDPVSFAAGGHACLELLGDLLEQRAAPEATEVASLPHSDALLRAASHVRHELANYQLVVRHARRCQLAVPMAGSGRRTLVDALFVEEAAPSGLLKAFARSDRDNTWTKSGFDLLGLYRPGARGTGADMTLSVAPESGLSLQTLWEELERMENDRWAGARPSDTPRVIASYAQATHAPNEPWWDDHGRYTLIGAPRMVSQKAPGTYGSKLGWYEDVLPAVWKCYSPIPIEPGGPHLVAHEEAHVGGKRLWHCGWSLSAGQSAGSRSPIPLPGLADTPTFAGWLKTLSSPEQRITSPVDVPPPETYRLLIFPGGRVVSHRDGVTIFESHSLADADRSAFGATFRDMAEASGDLAAFHRERALERALSYQHQLLTRVRSLRHADFDKWKLQIWEDRGRALRAAIRSVRHAEPWPVDEFRSSLATLWGFEERRRETVEAVEQIDRITSEIADSLRERRSRLVRAVGGGLALGLVGREIVDAFRQGLVTNAYEWQLEVFKGSIPSDAAGSLAATAHRLQMWDQAGMVVLLVGIIAGVIVYLTLDTKAAG